MTFSLHWKQKPGRELYKRLTKNNYKTFLTKILINNKPMHCLENLKIIQKQNRKKCRHTHQNCTKKH